MSKEIRGSGNLSPFQEKIIEAVRGAFNAKKGNYRISHTASGTRSLDLTVSRHWSDGRNAMASFILADGKITHSDGDPDLTARVEDIILEAIGNNPNKPLTELKVFGKYRHFKGGYYRVLFLSTHTETGEDLVNYRECGNVDGRVWSRPKEMFMDGRFHFVPED